MRKNSTLVIGQKKGGGYAWSPLIRLLKFRAPKNRGLYYCRTKIYALYSKIYLILISYRNRWIFDHTSCFSQRFRIINVLQFATPYSYFATIPFSRDLEAFFLDLTFFPYTQFFYMHFAHKFSTKMERLILNQKSTLFFMHSQPISTIGNPSI